MTCLFSLIISVKFWKIYQKNTSGNLFPAAGNQNNITIYAAYFFKKIKLPVSISLYENFEYDP